MKVLLQRTQYAAVTVDKKVIGEIKKGLLLFVGIDKQDDSAVLAKMAAKVLAYRVFADSEEKMNLSVRDISGEILVVSQFTLAANTQKGLRPSFSSAALPADAERLFEEFVNILRDSNTPVACGKFGADMQVSLCNDGPVTFLLEM